MAGLLRKATGRSGQVHAITPEAAGWSYVGFDLWRLSPGQTAAGITKAERRSLCWSRGGPK